MSLIPDELIARLPSFTGQEENPDPIVFARLYLPGTPEAWYVIGGQTAWGQHFYLYCLFTEEEEWGVGYFKLSALEAKPGPNNQPVVFDTDFKEGPLTDVVPAPDS